MVLGVKATPRRRDAIFKNITAMIVDATKVHRVTSFQYGVSYAEQTAVEDAIEYSQIIQHLYIPLRNAVRGGNFSNKWSNTLSRLGV